MKSSRWLEAGLKYLNNLRIFRGCPRTRDIIERLESNPGYFLIKFTPGIKQYSAITGAVGMVGFGYLLILRALKLLNPVILRHEARNNVANINTCSQTPYTCF